MLIARGAREENFQNNISTNVPTFAVVGVNISTSTFAVMQINGYRGPYGVGGSWELGARVLAGASGASERRASHASEVGSIVAGRMGSLNAIGTDGVEGK